MPCVFVLTCPYCKGKAILQDSKVVYRTRSYGWAWVCPNYPVCDAYVGCHPGTQNPLGTLANNRLRRLRGLAHDLFDKRWRRGKASRSRKSREGAYRWLAFALSLSREHCHIALFDEATCERVIELCTKEK